MTMAQPRGTAFSAVGAVNAGKRLSKLASKMNTDTDPIIAM